MRNEEVFKWNGFSKDIIDEYNRTLSFFRNRYRKPYLIYGVDIGFMTDDDCNLLTDPVVRVHEGNITSSRNKNKRFEKVDSSQFNVIHSEYRIKSAIRSRTKPQRSGNILRPGISIGFGNSSGTLCLIVKRLSGPRGSIPFALTCSHVKDGWDANTMIQPGEAHGGASTSDPIALSKSPGEREGFNYDGDFCIVELNGSRRVSNVIELQTIREKIKDIIYFKLREKVIKIGATTSDTYGVIDGIGTYFVQDTGRAWKQVDGFRVVPEKTCNQIILSVDGDSGAPILDLNGDKIGGMLFAGNDIYPSNESYIGCHLKRIQERINIDIF